MGYRSDQQGIMNRYLSEQAGWERHLNQTRNFISNTLSNRPEIETVAVLGSGWLLDVPLEFLSRTFRHVIMVDIMHPPQIAHKLSGFENVQLVEEDISGFMLPVWDFVQQNRKKKNPDRPETISTADIKTEIKADTYVSVNLMNQLDILLVDFMKKYMPFEEPDFIKFHQKIQQAHLDFLLKHDSILITDYEELIINKENKTQEIKPLIHCQLPPCSITEKWRWHFDESGSYYKNMKTHFKVIAMDLNTRKSDH